MRFDLEKPFSRVLLVYILWTACWIFGGSFFEVYFLHLGMSFQDIFLAECFWFVASMFTIPLVKRFKARDSMVVGIAAGLLSSALLFFLPGQPWTAFPFRFMVGLTHIAFWIPLNTMYYELRKESKDENAFLGALYYALTPILSLFLPAVGGLAAASFGYSALFMISMACFAITGVAAWMLVENKPYSYDLGNALRSISGLRSIIFLEGFSAAIIINVTLAIMPLIYITEPLQFGIFLSASTVFAVAASVFTARISDKAQRRREFLLPVVFLFGASTILMAFTHDFLTFFLCLGIVSFFSRIFFPLPLALLVDNSKNILDSMVGREFMLNFGRLTGAVVAYLAYLYTGFTGVLVIEGLAMVLYIPVFENRKRKLIRH